MRQCDSHKYWVLLVFFRLFSQFEPSLCFPRNRLFQTSWCKVVKLSRFILWLISALLISNFIEFNLLQLVCKIIANLQMIRQSAYYRVKLHLRALYFLLFSHGHIFCFPTFLPLVHRMSAILVAILLAVLRTTCSYLGLTLRLRILSLLARKCVIHKWAIHTLLLLAWIHKTAIFLSRSGHFWMRQVSAWISTLFRSKSELRDIVTMEIRVQFFWTEVLNLSQRTYMSDFTRSFLKWQVYLTRYSFSKRRVEISICRRGRRLFLLLAWISEASFASGANLFLHEQTCSFHLLSRNYYRALPFSLAVFIGSWAWLSQNRTLMRLIISIFILLFKCIGILRTSIDSRSVRTEDLVAIVLHSLESWAIFDSVWDTWLHYEWGFTFFRRARSDLTWFTLLSSMLVWETQSFWHFSRTYACISRHL